MAVTRKSDEQPSADDTGIVVTQVRSGIGTTPKHRGTLRALGLRGIGQSNVLPDRRDVRGMIARVPHLVTVVPAGAGALEAARGARVRRGRSVRVEERKS